MKKLLIVMVLASLLFIIAMLPILAAQFYTFDDDAQGWSPSFAYRSYDGHLAPGCMHVSYYNSVSISKTVTLTDGDLSFWANWDDIGGHASAIVSIDSTPVCTFPLSFPSYLWQNFTCTLTYPGSHNLSLSYIYDEQCGGAQACEVNFDEISVPEGEEGPIPTPALPFRSFLPILYRAAIP